MGPEQIAELKQLAVVQSRALARLANIQRVADRYEPEAHGAFVLMDPRDVIALIALIPKPEAGA